MVIAGMVDVMLWLNGNNATKAQREENVHGVSVSFSCQKSGKVFR